MAVQATRLRLRPILMTAFAFIFGVLPLMIATDPGEEMRQSLGTARVLRDARSYQLRVVSDACLLRAAALQMETESGGDHSGLPGAELTEGASG